MTTINGLRALVTGGASGIRKVIALHLCRAGARVHVADFAAGAMQQVADDLPGVTGTLADVSSEPNVERLFADVQTQLGGLDLLVNNAGIAGPTCPVEDVTLADWQRTLDVNLTGAFLCARRLCCEPMASPRCTRGQMGKWCRGGNGFGCGRPDGAAAAGDD